MRNKIFFDSSFLVAVLLANDSQHQQAISLGKKLGKARYIRLISNYILLETLTVLRRRSSQAMVKEAIKLLTDPRLKIIRQSELLDEITIDNFLSDSKEQLSFVDASILTSMRHEGVKYLVTFDRHLSMLAREQGFQVWS